MTRLEKVSHICLITLTLVATGILLDKRFNPPITISTDPEGSLHGKKLNLSGISWTSADANVVIYLSDHCPYCDKSVPFFQKLSKLQALSNGKIKLFAASSESSTKIKMYLDAHQIVANGIVQTDRTQNNFSATPTVVLVNSSGIVQSAYVGLLTDEREMSVISKVVR